MVFLWVILVGVVIVLLGVDSVCCRFWPFVAGLVVSLDWFGFLDCYSGGLCWVVCVLCGCMVSGGLVVFYAGFWWFGCVLAFLVY